MAWWSWMVIGMVLLAAELFIVEADFFLVFLGAAAIITGLIGVAVPELPQSMQWLIFAVLALTSMILFRKRVYKLLRRDVPDMANDMLSERLTLPVGLPVDGSCRVELRGSTWTARNVGTEAIPPGVNVRIVGVEGVTLRVEVRN
ncbi:MAG: NfeD family protein [Gammaproteobacteria bacterium]|nr:NfeD family protein [Gammaproteobacteria bacterium]